MGVVRSVWCVWGGSCEVCTGSENCSLLVSCIVLGLTTTEANGSGKYNS